MCHFFRKIIQLQVDREISLCHSVLCWFCVGVVLQLFYVISNMQKKPKSGPAPEMQSRSGILVKIYS